MIVMTTAHPFNDVDHFLKDCNTDRIMLTVFYKHKKKD